MRPLLLPLALAPASCIVTSAPVIQEVDDCPPSFLNNEAIPPSNKFSTVDSTTTPLQFEGSVTLRSCATAKAYKGRIFLDKQLLTELPIPANGEPTREATAVVVDLTGKSNGCHVVELLASTDYAPDATLRTPLKQGDLATITWLIDLETPGTPGTPIVGEPCK